MKYTNKELFEYYNILDSIAEKVTGKLAYIVIKNAHKIRNELEEYNQIRDHNIAKYGYRDNEYSAYKITINSDEYYHFCNDMQEYDEIEQDISFMMVDPKDLYSSQLNAVEIDQLSFMIEDEDA